MDFLDYTKNAFSNLLKNAKKDIEKAFSKQNIEKVLKPLKKAAKTAEKEIDEYFENMKFSTEQLMKINYLPGSIDVSEKKEPYKQKILKKTTKPAKKINQLPENTEIEILWKLVKSESRKEKKRLFDKLVKDYLQNKRLYVKMTTKDKRTFRFMFNEDFLKRIDKILNAETRLDKTYGSDDEITTLFFDNEPVNIEIEYVAVGKNDKGRYMPYFHTLDKLNLHILQFSRGIDDKLKRFAIDGTINDEDFIVETGIQQPDKAKNMYERTRERLDHCLIHSLKVLKATPEEIEKVKEFIGYNSFRTRDLKKLGELLSCNFKLTKIPLEDKESQTVEYGDKLMERTYHLVLFAGHYMPNVEFPLTKYAVINYDEVKNFTNWNRVKYIQTMKDGRRVAQRVKPDFIINTIDVISSIKKSNRLYWNDTIYEKTEERNDMDLSKITEQNLIDSQKEAEIITPKKTNTDLIFGADFESHVSDVERHKAFLLGCVSLDGAYKRVFKAKKDDLDKVIIFGEMLKSITDTYGDKMKEAKLKNRNSKFIIYFHNLKYDYSLVQAYSFITFSNECAKGGQLYSTGFTFEGFQFELRDSYKMITMPLRDFQKSLGLKNGKKDFLLYQYFNKDNLDKEFESLEELQKFDKKLTAKKLKKRKLEHFLTEDELSLRVKDFYIDYMIADCETMMEGLKKFNQLSEEMFQLSSFDFLTISSMAHCYLNNKCYRGVCSVSGLCREFITRANVGGRVCLQNNKKQNRVNEGLKEYIEISQKINKETDEDTIKSMRNVMSEFRQKNKKIQDFDGVSLYPSAMSRSCIPLGRAKVLTPEQCRELEKDTFMYSYYVVEVRLELSNDDKIQQIPFLCCENEDGTRDWSNTPAKTITMTKIDLINLPKYYTIKSLEITQGLYWNEGGNNTVQEVITEIFQARLKAKSEKNDGLQNMLKLFMNSAYGKCNVKASKSNIKYIRKRDLKNFIQNNFDFIKNMTSLDENNDDNDRFRVKLTKHTYVHTNLAHVAGIYLSNSKVIMNDLLNVFTLLGIEVLYTDTDSIHIYEKDIAAIAKKYKELYGRELIGKQLGQFHDDFEPYTPKFDNNGVKIPKDENGGRRGYPQHSIGFIGLGKKVYIDVLANDFNDEVNYHIRFKGANEANILEYCKNNKLTLVEFYEKLLRGDKVKLNLCAGKTRFDYDKKGRVFTKKEFYRCFDFLTKEEKAAKALEKKSRKETIKSAPQVVEGFTQ